MISCKFAGGLGNNLFQLANIYALHEKYSVPYFIDKNFKRLTFDGKPLKDDSRFKQSHSLEFEALFENNFPDDREENLNMKDYYHHDLRSDSNFMFSEVEFRDNTMYHGYFQSEKYFADSNFKNNLILNSKIVNNIREKYENLFCKPTISLQYRLGGDRKLSKIQKFHKNLKPSYYVKSVNKILEVTKKDIEDFNILVFSDDIQLSKKALDYTDLNCTFIENKNNVEDFIHMSLCDHNVIGNSTFAWWAAYLNSNDGLVVGPKDFFGSNYGNFSLDDFYPDEWIVL